MSGVITANEVIVRCVPRRYYWFIGPFLYPIASFVFTAILVRPALLLFGVDLRGRSLLVAWGVVTVIVVAWAYARDYRRLCFTLSSDALALGRGAAATKLPFGEIQSVVLGLPDRLPWWLRIQRFSPEGGGLYRNLVRSRERTLLLRLTRGRYLPLNLTYSFFTDGQAFMTELLRRNQRKLVGRETYTEGERRGLATVRFNALKTLLSVAVVWLALVDFALRP